MTTVISPGIGHAPMFTQAGVGASPGYDMVDLRRAINAGTQEGVMEATSYEVTQRGAGANMSVDIAANATPAPNGAAGYVQGDAVTGQGLYTVPAHSAVINEAIGAAHATLPRVDRVILELQDHTHDASGENRAQTRVVPGTATSGATLDNLTGAAAVPSSALLLADVLVPAADTTIANSQIRDRRKWARGAFCQIVRNADAGGGDDYSTTSTNIALVDGTNLAPRIECSGVPIRVTLLAGITATDAGGQVYISPQVDSAGLNGMPDVGESSTFTNWTYEVSVANDLQVVNLTQIFVPSPGSRVIAPAWASGSATMFARAGRPLIWTVEEIVRQNTRNNATTTG